MQEHLTKVELYGIAAEVPIETYAPRQRETELIVNRNEKTGIKTFLILCHRTGKLLIKFDTMEETKCDNETG
jgi:hypothetical protein